MAWFGLAGLAAAGICIPAGVVSYEVAVAWARKNKKEAIDYFWDIELPLQDGGNTIDSNDNPTTQAGHAYNVPTQRTSEAKSHRERIDNLQDQAGLQYEALSSEDPQIRLIHLEPCNSSTDPIRCFFTTVDLVPGIPYVALSYCWGDTNHLRQIYVDDRPVKITQNLHDALVELRRRGNPLIWVDMLCIDQDNKVEKARQIQQMSMIYSRAQSVISWLGKEDESFIETTQALKQLCEFRKSPTLENKELVQSSVLLDLIFMWIKKIPAEPTLKPLYFRRGQDRAPALARLVGKVFKDLPYGEQFLRERQLEFIESLDRVVKMEYWRRAWILQEVIVSDSLEIICGPHDLDFDTLSEVLFEMRRLSERNLIRRFSREHEHIVNLGLLREKWRPREPIYLLEALQASAHTDASWDIDKVYSLFSVCFDSSRFVTRVDYSLDLNTLLRNMTELSIDGTKSLDIICLQSPVRDSSADMPLPSWAPDWRRIGSHPFNHRMIKYLTGQDDHPRPGFKSRYWNATGHSHGRQTVFLDKNRILRVRGRSLGKIKSLSFAAGFKYPAGTPNPDGLQNDDIKGIQLTPLEFQGTAYIISHLFHAFTVYGAFEFQADATAGFRAIFDKENLKSIIKEKPLVHECLIALQSFQIGGRSLQDWSTSHHEQKDFQSIAEDKIQRFALHALTLSQQEEDIPFRDMFNARKRQLRIGANRVVQDGLRLMDTTQGLVGWAHPAATWGDEVVLIEGCTIPVILRRCAAQYGEDLTFEVIGDAYVCGAMYGAFWSDDEKDLQYIYLR